jgi:hypothetical protein
MAEDTVMPSEAKGAETVDGNTGIGWVLATALAFAVSAGLLAAYHFLLPPPAPRFGRVDLASVVAESQRGFADRVAKGETQAALDEATRAGQEPEPGGAAPGPRMRLRHPGGRRRGGGGRGPDAPTQGAGSCPGLSV